jgi:hypothetical protein
MAIALNHELSKQGNGIGGSSVATFSRERLWDLLWAPLQALCSYSASRIGGDRERRQRCKNMAK